MKTPVSAKELAKQFCQEMIHNLRENVAAQKASKCSVMARCPDCTMYYPLSMGNCPQGCGMNGVCC